MIKDFNIEGKKIGLNQPVFTIAEIASNHNRSKNTVKKLIDASGVAGFDAVKFQIYDPRFREYILAMLLSGLLKRVF
jgi:N-acetylneuraminate synthase